jgi:PilZ domain
MFQRWLKTPLSGSRDRRQRQRINQYFDCTWQSAWGEERARVISLSPTGCYIESRFSVPATGTAIHDLTVALPTGNLHVQGTVVDAMLGVGFALRFTELDTDTLDRLKVLVQDAHP